MMKKKYWSIDLVESTKVEDSMEAAAKTAEELSKRIKALNNRTITSIATHEKRR